MTHSFPHRRAAYRASSRAFRVADPKAAYDHASKEGATPVDAGRGILGDDAGAIEGIGGSYLYLVQAGADLYADWQEVPGWREAEAENNVGLEQIGRAHV